MTLLFAAYLEGICIFKGGFGGIVISMLASGTQDRGFAPSRSLRIFRAKKSSANPLPHVAELRHAKDP
jgi:hypothetical protein